MLFRLSAAAALQYHLLRDARHGWCGCGAALGRDEDRRRRHGRLPRGEGMLLSLDGTLTSEMQMAGTMRVTTRSKLAMKRVS